MLPNRKALFRILVFVILTSNYATGQKNESTPAKFRKNTYEINLGGCLQKVKIQFVRVGVNLYSGEEGTLFFLTYSAPSPEHDISSAKPVFIQRFPNNCSEFIDTDTVVDFSSYDIGNCIDVESFEMLTPDTYKDKWRYYHHRPMSDGGHLTKGKAHSYTELTNEFFLGSDSLIYIETQQLIQPPEEYSEVFFRSVPVEDPFSFEDLSGYYSRDTTHVYRDWATTSGRFIKIIPEADPKTFEEIFYRLGKDKNHVFYNGRIIEDLNVDSLVVLCKQRSDNSVVSYSLIKDDKAVFYDDKKLSTIDAASFECIMIDNDLVFRDKNWIYEEDYFPGENPDRRKKRE